MKKHIGVVALAALALSACASGPNGGGPGGLAGGGRGERGERRPLPPIGDPGKVAATDIAFSLAARDDGQWSAFRQYAANGAVMHLADGPVEASAFLANRADPATPMSWSPDRIWASCDGSLAVTKGRFIDADGKVGSYATVWTLQSDQRSYKWVYDIGALDDPQPPPAPPPAPDPEPGSPTIVVPGLSMTRGYVADCGSAAAAQPVTEQMPGETLADNGSARDSSLAYAWYHRPDGSRLLKVEWLHEGSWQDALDFEIPASR